MDIGTAKPTAAEQAEVRHHIIDVVDPDEGFSLAAWLELANASLEDIWSRGKQPFLVGGTGQYVWALIEGWRVPRVPPQPDLRARMAEHSAEDLLSELRAVDPEAERYIDPRNVRRVVRALEVSAATGKPFSYWRTKEAPAFDALIVGLTLPRRRLYERIDRRVDSMFEEGLVDEVSRLLERGYGSELPSMSGIGYREVCEYLAGESTLEAAVERTKTGTHRLARHQYAWFKPNDLRIHWIDAESADVHRLAAELTLTAGG
jgi:tRNA dimethylallyltransferase